MFKLQSVHPTQNQKQMMHENNKLCMFQKREEKADKNVKKNKSNFIDVIGDEFDRSIT